MTPYRPPFTITPEMLTLVAEVSLTLGKLAVVQRGGAGGQGSANKPGYVGDNVGENYQAYCGAGAAERRTSRAYRPCERREMENSQEELCLKK